MIKYCFIFSLGAVLFLTQILRPTWAIKTLKLDFNNNFPEREVRLCPRPQAHKTEKCVERKQLMLFNHFYEQDTPNMSRAKCLKSGESAVNTALNRIPVHLLTESSDA